MDRSFQRLRGAGDSVNDGALFSRSNGHACSSSQLTGTPHYHSRLESKNDESIECTVPYCLSRNFTRETLPNVRQGYAKRHFYFFFFLLLEYGPSDNIKYHPILGYLFDVSIRRKYRRYHRHLYLGTAR